MKTMRVLLDSKGHKVWSIGPEATVLDAIEQMAAKDIGALMVLEDDKPIGIFTERHYARKVFLEGKRSPTTPIRDVMAVHVICAGPDQTVEQCMAVMTEKQVRHLPVMDGDELIGIVSIGDLVKSIIADQKFTIEQLEHYITG